MNHEQYQGGVYALVNQRTGKAYIGGTNNFQRRAKEHRWYLASGGYNIKFEPDRNDPFEFVIVGGLPQHLIKAGEQLCLDHLRENYSEDEHYNIALDAVASLKGLPLTEEHKAKIAAANLGRHHTEASKAKQSAAMKGRPSPNKGKRSSLETRQKLSRARAKTFTGFVSADGTLEPPITNLLVWCKERGLHQGAMHNVYMGSRKHHRGWTCNR